MAIRHDRDECRFLGHRHRSSQRKGLEGISP
jgi:hypothetical protein